MSLLRQPLSRAYAVTTGNAESKTGGDWYKFYMLTADHGDEWWFLLFLCGGACAFCFYHCFCDNCFWKPDINNIIWIKKTAQRRLSPELGTAGSRSCWECYMTRPWTAELKELLKEIHEE